MKVVYSDEQKNHYPKQFLVNGIMQPNPEMPERCNRLLAGALDAGCELVSPQEAGMEPIKAIHSERYLKFLENAWERWARIAHASESVIPNIHPNSRQDLYPKSVVAQAGFHMSDLACPLGAESWKSILWSAWTAVQAAEWVKSGDDLAYALCRPPGHHAFAEIAGGFCYLNNSAIAAQTLRNVHDRVAILDVDLHHGNGTQGIFYHRNDVLTVSLHADPIRFYPFFWGSEDERGTGEGAGFNYNFPLPRGSGDEVFLAALDQALDRIKAFKPTALVVALGLDAFAGDPFGGLAISTTGFRRIGRRISDSLGLPAVIVQEGGYLCDELGDNLAAFLRGFEQKAC
jgi:acetoin utilization deacetylase AcuC-like enzyme